KETDHWKRSRFIRSWSPLRRSLGPWAGSAPEEVMANEHRYRGYRLVPGAQGEGWRVDVYAPGARTAELVITCAGATAGTEGALDDARWAVDRLMDSR